MRLLRLIDITCVELINTGNSTFINSDIKGVLDERDELLKAWLGRRQISFRF